MKKRRPGANRHEHKDRNSKRPGGPRDKSGDKTNDKGSASRPQHHPRDGKVHKKENPDARLGPSGGSINRGFRTFKATVQKNQKGFAFLVLDSEEFEDLFLNPREAIQYFHGDRIEIKVSNTSHEVIGIRVLEHRFRELVGRFTAYPYPQVIYERKRFKELIGIKNIKTQPKNGDWVRVAISFSGQNVEGEIVEIYGEEFPASADIAIVAGEYNLHEKHSEHAIRQAQGYKLVVEDVLKDPHRKDLRNVPFITIDGETARDFDDAVYVEKKGSNYILWVGIADVSHYVSQASPLDEEAFARGTSVYFPERAFHMLPRELSENLCSLKPNQPRLAFVSKIEIDSNGKKLKTELIEAVIESQRRATYNEIEAEYQKDGKNPDFEYKTHFELYRILRKARTDRGSIDFELPEAEMRVDDQGEPTEIVRRPRLDAHRLIEEFMIAANESVTEWMLHHKRPFIYRVHEDPSEKSLLRFQKIAVAAGFNFMIPKKMEPKILADFVRTVQGHPAEELLNTMLLRSMRQAVYASIHHGHFGLASGAYTHFTSPIRRYPDLVVHRLLREAVRNKSDRPDEVALAKKEKDLDMIAGHCSYRERIASDADREAARLKQVRYMKRHLGDEFMGKVIGMSENALFIQIQEPWVEGMIPKDEFTEANYEFDEERMVYVSRRKGKLIKIGDQFEVQVIKADLDKREVQLKPLEHFPLGNIDRVDTSKR